MSIVDDFKSIARLARLRELEGRPQSCPPAAVEMPCDSNTDPDWYAFAGYGPIYTAPEEDCA